MAYTEPVDRALAELITPPIWNAEVAANFRAMGPHLLARKSSDQTVTSSITPVNDTGLVTPSIPANERWLLYWHLLYTTPSATAGIRLSWAFPASGGPPRLTFVGPSTGALPVGFGISGATNPTTALQLGAFSTGSDVNTLWLPMVFANAGTAGTVQLQWAQTTSNATGTVMKTDSTLWGVKLA